MTGTILETPQYMSPEQVSGKRTVDHRTDIWSFGIVAYECVTGHRVFATDTLSKLVLAICNDPLPIPSLLGAVPKGFDEWFARCAHHDPERRFLSIAEAGDILRFVCGLDLNSTVGVPQLYSEPPPSPYVQRTAPLTPRPSSPAAGSTVAPSMLSMGNIAIPKEHFPKYLLLGLLLITAAGLAVLLNLGRGGSAPAAALPAGLTLPTSSRPEGPLKSDAGAPLLPATTTTVESAIGPRHRP